MRCAQECVAAPCTSSNTARLGGRAVCRPTWQGTNAQVAHLRVDHRLPDLFGQPSRSKHRCMHSPVTHTVAGAACFSAGSRGLRFSMRSIGGGMSKSN